MGRNLQTCTHYRDSLGTSLANSSTITACGGSSYSFLMHDPDGMLHYFVSRSTTCPGSVFAWTNSLYDFILQPQITETTSACSIYIVQDLYIPSMGNCWIFNSQYRDIVLTVNINLPPKFNTPMALSHSVNLYDTLAYPLPSYSDPNGASV